MKVKLLKLKLVVFSVQCYSLMWKPNLYLKLNISIKGNIWFHPLQGRTPDAFKFVQTVTAQNEIEQF